MARVLGTEVVAFAYPYGFWNAAALDFARATFGLSFTVTEGLNSRRTSLHLIRRTLVLPSDSQLDLACRVRLGWSPIEYLTQRAWRALRDPKRIKRAMRRRFVRHR